MSSSHPAPSSVAGLLAVKAKIAEAALAADRDPATVTLVAVSKQQPWDVVAPVLAAGHRVFGENRVQEAMGRWRDVRGDVDDLELRLIGPLQTNKAREAAAFFDVIETLDRQRLAVALADAVQKEGRCPTLFLQVNTGEEPQKAGVVPDAADDLIARARKDYDLIVEGLMCIPPAGDPPFLHFALLKNIADRNGLKKLSMGMSGDFQTAVTFGATSVRVGSAIFGARP